MARKHNTPHLQRGRSHYSERLAKRGVRSTDVLMEDVEDLRRRQDRQLRAAGQIPWARPDADVIGDVQAAMSEAHDEVGA
jgi:hypothetical protein